MTDDRSMERVNLRMPHGLLRDIDEQIRDGRFANRSEAIRAGVRQLTLPVATEGDADE